MKEFFIGLFITLGIINPFANAVPPEINKIPPEEMPHIEMLYTEEEIYVAAQMIQGEAGSDYLTYDEKASVLCTVCNRLKNNEFDIYGDSLIEQIKYPYQYVGWHSWIVPTEYHLQIAEEVLWRDSQIQQGVEAKWETDCYFFHSENNHNVFT